MGWKANINWLIISIDIYRYIQRGLGVIIGIWSSIGGWWIGRQRLRDLGIVQGCWLLWHPLPICHRSLGYTIRWIAISTGHPWIQPATSLIIQTFSTASRYSKLFAQDVFSTAKPSNRLIDWSASEKLDC